LGGEIGFTVPNCCLIPSTPQSQRPSQTFNISSGQGAARPTGVREGSGKEATTMNDPQSDSDIEPRPYHRAIHPPYISGQQFSAATLRPQPTSAIEHAGTRSHYIWEGKRHLILLSKVYGRLQE
jgi:hypothetical protein